MSSKIEKLNELGNLFKAGTITNAEFEVLKREILSNGAPVQNPVTNQSEIKLESIPVAKQEKKKDPERIIWEGNPGQIKMVPAYLFFSFCALCFLISTYVVPILFLLFLGSLLGIYLSNKAIKNYKIRITTHRITVEEGVFSKTTEEIELFRVKDIQLEEPFFYRSYNLSDITIISSDRTNRICVIPAIKDGKRIREELRNAVDERREAKGVREFDDSRF
jgi:uncharacterized membrane protein YdbT with pleckstrin-like domain